MTSLKNRLTSLLEYVEAAAQLTERAVPTLSGYRFLNYEEEQLRNRPGITTM